MEGTTIRYVFSHQQEANPFYGIGELKGRVRH